MQGLVLGGIRSVDVFFLPFIMRSSSTVVRFLGGKVRCFGLEIEIEIEHFELKSFGSLEARRIQLMPLIRLGFGYGVPTMNPGPCYQAQSITVTSKP